MITYKKNGMKPTIVTTINGPTEFTPLEPVLRVLNSRSNVKLRMFSTLEKAIDFSKALSIDLVDERDLFYLLKHKSTGLLLLAADFIHPWHSIGHRSTCVARLHKIPSLSIQHGLFLDGKDPYLYSSFTADKMAVWGNTFRDILVQDGMVRKSRLLITGNPYFDNLVKLNSIDARQNIGSLFNMAIDDRIILIAIASHSLTKVLSIPDREAIAFVTALIEGCLENGANVIIKPHPADEAHGAMFVYHEAIKHVRKTGKVFLASAQDSVHSFIAAADIVVSQASTVIFEALIKGKSIACFRLPSMPNIIEPLAQTSNKFINISASLDEMPIQVINSINHLIGIKDEPLRESGPLVRDLELARKGGAAERVAQRCLSMVRTSSKLYAHGRNIYRLLK